MAQLSPALLPACRARSCSGALGCGGWAACLAHDQQPHLAQSPLLRRVPKYHRHSAASSSPPPPPPPAAPPRRSRSSTSDPPASSPTTSAHTFRWAPGGRREGERAGGLGVADQRRAQPYGYAATARRAGSACRTILETSDLPPLTLPRPFPTPSCQSRSYRAPEVILGLPYDQKVCVWGVQAPRVLRTS